MAAAATDQVTERLKSVCPEFEANVFLARTGKCLLIRGILAGLPAVAKCLVEPDPYWSARFLEEIRWYRLFERRPPPVVVPRLLFADEARAISILELLHGQPLNNNRYVAQPLPLSQVETLLAQLARLHSWHVPQAQSTSEVVAEYHEKFQGYAERGLLNANDCSVLATLLEREESTPEFNHGDVLPSNCLALGSGLALIDWEFAGYYLPGYDLALLWTLLRADSAARRRIEAVVQQQGLAAERTFVINQMRVIAREINIHRKQIGGATHDQRISWLETDRDTVRVLMQAYATA